MLDPSETPPIDHQEITARFLVSRSHVNKQAMTVKADAFVPPNTNKLSVTRLIEITDDEIWGIGQSVADTHKPSRTLRGRADVLASAFIYHNLEVIPQAVEGNPNHANVIGWPSTADEFGQMMIAKEIAAAAIFVEPPNS